jgi:hypothetical protein
MAFGGVNDLALLNENAGAGGRNICEGLTLTLAANVGAFAVAAADSGRLVSAAAGANETALPATFGPGRGNWTAADLQRLTVIPPTATGVTAIVKNIAKTLLAGGNIQIDFHSEGAGAATTRLVLRMVYEHSAIM